ncbi:AAA family ATPase [Alistipes sp.]|uniref:AAA family ATPase n=1 Tax=Alistipes sp. TaxID=1872444 RepID=UPI003AEF7779
MAFRLKSIQLHTAEIPLVNPKRTSISENFYTLLIGNNGTGKSTILSSIARHFNTLLNNKRQTSNTVCLKYQNLPSKVIALTNSISDKFPTDERYRFRYRIKNTNFKDSRYIYLGARSMMNGFSARALMNKALDIVLENYSDRKISNIYQHVFNYLEYAPILKLNYRFSFRTMNYAPKSKKDIVEYIYDILQDPRQNFINENFVSLVESRMAELCEFIEGNLPKENRNSIIINFSSRNIERLSEDNSEYLEQLRIYNLINILRKLEIVSNYEIRVFKKNGGEFNFSEASSGEACILSTMLGLIPVIENDCLVLIDEPEISLHPSWQSRYIDLLSGIFSNFHGCHIIIASHSHFLVTDLPPRNSAVVVLQNDGYDITGKLLNQPTFGWSAENILLNVFQVPSTRNYYLSQKISRSLELIAERQMDTQEFKQLRSELVTYYKLLKETDPLKEIISLIRGIRLDHE